MSDDDSILVACLCADWCYVCQEYRASFEQVGARFPQARFLWIDIEDQSDLVDPIEVDDFPTLLIAAGATPRFFGVMTTRAEKLERLVRDRCAAVAPSVSVGHPDVLALVGRLRGLSKKPDPCA